jgi:hypothetical protein
MATFHAGPLSAPPHPTPAQTAAPLPPNALPHHLHRSCPANRCTRAGRRNPCPHPSLPSVHIVAPSDGIPGAPPCHPARLHRVPMSGYDHLRECSAGDGTGPTVESGTGSREHATSLIPKPPGALTYSRMHGRPAHMPRSWRWLRGPLHVARLLPPRSARPSLPRSLLPDLAHAKPPPSRRLPQPPRPRPGCRGLDGGTGLVEKYFHRRYHVATERMARPFVTKAVVRLPRVHDVSAEPRARPACSSRRNASYEAPRPPQRSRPRG